jgi:hypothetical protein
MVGFALGNSGKFVNEEYLTFREKALRNTHTLREWGDIDTTKYDLDNLQFSSKDNVQTYTFRRAVEDDEIAPNGFDVRTLPTHD